MEWQFVGGGILVLLVIFIGVGLPIPFALVAASLPFLWTIQDFSTSLISAELMLWRVWANYILLAVPLFVFLGELVGRSRIGPRLYHMMHRGAPMTGSAAYGSVGACAGFGAIGGSSMIGALTIGSVALPEMLRLGYGKRIASGVIAAGGTLSVLIPPSLILLFYGIVTEVSIGQLFIAGVIPGLLLTGFFVIVILGWRMLRPNDIPESDRGGKWLTKDTLLALAPVVVIAFVIIASIYFGIATPTEAAAVAVVVTIIHAATVGKLPFQGFVDALRSTLRTMGFLGLLLSAALLMGFVLNYHRVPQQFTEAFVALELSLFLVLLMAIAFYLIVGMFLEIGVDDLHHPAHVVPARQRRRLRPGVVRHHLHDHDGDCGADSPGGAGPVCAAGACAVRQSRAHHRCHHRLRAVHCRARRSYHPASRLSPARTVAAGGDALRG